MTKGTTNTPGTAGGVDLSDGVVRKVARLSRLALNDQAIARSGEQLKAILGYIDRLRELDLEGVEPMAHPLEMSNRFDEDVEREGLPTAALMKMAPATSGAFVKVPKVLGEEGGA